MPIHILKHCRLYAEPEDGSRLLVMRYWPRGCRKDQFSAWLPDLAPSAKLLAWVKKQYQSPKCDPPFIEESWRDRYTSEMEQQSELISHLRGRHLAGETLTLLCSCHDPNKCHRTVLRDLILKTGDKADVLA